MGVYKLVALNDVAKNFDSGSGADLLLKPYAPVVLGRAASKESGYRYPQSWAQISSRHCKIFVDHDNPGQVTVTPMSLPSDRFVPSSLQCNTRTLATACHPCSFWELAWSG